MIQRIQTLFLLAVSALLLSMFFVTMASDAKESIRFTDITQLLIMNIVTFGLSSLSIFLYKYRMLQIRLSIFNIIILVAFQSWILWLFFSKPEGSAFTIYSVFPAVSALLTLMAVRYIARDEAMVRSVSRLRKKGKK
ncbi:MAG: DUF4293 family protein [Bacteroidales bacterium]